MLWCLRPHVRGISIVRSIPPMTDVNQSANNLMSCMIACHFFSTPVEYRWRLEPFDSYSVLGSGLHPNTDGFQILRKDSCAVRLSAIVRGPEHFELLPQLGLSVGIERREGSVGRPVIAAKEFHDL